MKQRASGHCREWRKETARGDSEGHPQENAATWKQSFQNKASAFPSASWAPVSSPTGWRCGTAVKLQTCKLEKGPRVCVRARSLRSCLTLATPWT